MTTDFGASPRTRRPGRAVPLASTPSNTARAVSRLPSVAESPHVRSAGRHVRSRARQSSVCTPRLVPINSCHSSTTTASRSAKKARASGWERRSDRLSGVVMSAVGGFLSWRPLAWLETSPVRRSTVHGRPRSTSGARRACSVSAASARSGVIQRTRNRGGWAGQRVRSGLAASHYFDVYPDRIK